MYESIIYSTTCYVIPFFTLIILSFRIIRKIKSARTFRKTLTCSENRENRSTRLILSIIGLFLVCHTLSMLRRLLKNFIQTTRQDQFTVLLAAFADVLANLKYSVWCLLFSFFHPTTSLSQIKNPAGRWAGFTTPRTGVLLQKCWRAGRIACKKCE